MATLLVVATQCSSGTPPTRSLDGRGNNPDNPDWGRVGARYTRVARAAFADGRSAMTAGKPERYVSNRIFNDSGHNLFSENNVSQWGWVWGQFLDHDIGLRDQTPAEKAPIPFDQNDPLESFDNDLGAMSFARTPAARGTGTSSARQQVNTLSSYIDASGVYGTSAARLDWLREGSLDGDPTNNAASLLLPDGLLPRADARGNAKRAPTMELFGALRATPEKARVAGDTRANENIGLTAVHTLFAREHNRIVAALPRTLSEEERFQIARRVVGAEIQYITYTQFLPSLGAKVSAYRGYDPEMNAGLSNEFAVVGYRAHSMVPGQFDVPFGSRAFTPEQIAAFRAQGIDRGEKDQRRALQVPLTVAFGNPDLLERIGFGRFLSSLSAGRQYRNDEQVDDALRSVLFQVPKPGVRDPAVCGQPVVRPGCFAGVMDLTAIDIARGRDHGIPPYNELRRAYGLAPKATFTEITGEPTDRFPSDPAIDRANPIDDPNILDVLKVADEKGGALEVRSKQAQEKAVTGLRRTTLAARLKAIYGTVDSVDAFVGMLSEGHVEGSEFGELQLAMWKRQFEALRDGDRFFYRNDPTLREIERRYGINYRRTMSQIITLNTGADLPADVFEATAANTYRGVETD